MTPNPGSKKAIALGCKCPVIDNHYGAGFLMDGERVFWYQEGCPVHTRSLDKMIADAQEEEIEKDYRSERREQDSLRNGG